MLICAYKIGKTTFVSSECADTKCPLILPDKIQSLILYGYFANEHLQMFRRVLHTPTLDLYILHKRPPKCDAFFRAFPALACCTDFSPVSYLSISEKSCMQAAAEKARRRRHGASSPMTSTEIHKAHFFGLFLF